MGLAERFFRLQARRPLPFAVVLPAIFIALVAVGWTRDDIVEREVSEIWIRKSGQYYDDKEYAESVRSEAGGGGRGEMSNFAAMAVARDGGSLFTAERLEEIRARMEVVEKETKIEYKGHTFTYDDLCASNNIGEGTTYKAPCFRLSPMDYFLEADWFFDEDDRVTYYEKVYQDLVVAPRLKRFGALTGVCLPPNQNAEWCEANDQPTFVNCSCAHTYRLRTDPAYAVENGYPASYANPFSLFSDIGNLENNDRCKICIEQGFDGIITQLLEGMTAMISMYKKKLQQLANDESISEDDIATANAELAKIEEIESDLSRASVETFNHYFTARSLYAEFGAGIYQDRYADGMSTADPNTGVTLSGLCLLLRQDPEYCAASIDLPTAKNHLIRHADNTFSSTNAGGLPFPFFGEAPDGSITLFSGTNPFSGSGLDLSGGESLGFPGKPLQGLGYLMPLAASGEIISFNSTGFQLLALDPILVWYKSALTDAGDVKCSNNDIPGTSGLGPIDAATAQGMADVSPQWCTKYNVGSETQQTVARMWYDLLVDSDSFLSVTQGNTTPYSWTLGQGCGYQLMGQRFAYTGQSEEDILSNTSSPLYYYDEGEILGVLDTTVLIADDTDGVLQSVYFTLLPEDIVERVKNCNRPGGSIASLSVDDAREVLYQFKGKWEEAWSEGWDDDSSSNVTFSGFWDDSGAVGTTGRMLDKITLSSGSLMTISFIIIIIVSALFLFSFDVVRSRVLLTIVGVLLVILAFFAALGVAILSGLKLNITVGWTLPFILIGLGVDDFYIVSLALTDCLTEDAFIDKMAGVVSPVTMTSLVVFAMFGVMNVSDIPAVYVTARCGMISVAFLWLMIVTCVPAICYVDIKRQASGRYDVLFCMKKKVPEQAAASEQVDVDSGDAHRGMSGYVYDFVYKPLVIKDGISRLLFGIFVLSASLALLGVSIWGLASRTTIGLGLDEFFPVDHQASVWAHASADHLASWPITMNWGALDYGNPDVQLKMIKMFEDVLGSPHVSETETIQLWLANFLIWTTKHCDENFARQDANRRECGMDMVYQTDNSTCTGEWTRNNIDLADKVFVDEGKDECEPLEGGICRPVSQMHHEDLALLQAKGLYNPSVDDENTSYCPVFPSGTSDKMKFCVERWREMTGGGGNLVVIEGTDSESATCPGESLTDGQIQSPIPLSQGPIMFGKYLYSHEDTVNLITETRSFCDDDPEVHCWMTGVPYDYWEQYLYVDTLLAEVGGYALLAVFCVSMAFLLLKVGQERGHGKLKTFVGSSVGSLLIALTGLISVVTVSGLSSLAGVSLTSFSVMSFVLSIGYTTEYSVHIIHRWLRAPSHLITSKERVEHTMEFLFLPTFLSFVSSTIGVICLAFTEFHFNLVYFFRPLIIVMFVTYGYGCYLLPIVLSYIDLDFVKLGPSTSVHESQAELLGTENNRVKSPRSDDKIEDVKGSERDNAETLEVPTAVVPPEGSDDAQ